MTLLILWLVVLGASVLWGGRGWISVVQYRRLLDVERLRHAVAQREHWRALGATYGTVQAAKGELAEANERLVELEVANRLLLRSYQTFTVYVGEDAAAIDTDALLLNEVRVHLETAGLLRPERRETVS